MKMRMEIEAVERWLAGWVWLRWLRLAMCTSVHLPYPTAHHCPGPNGCMHVKMEH